MKGIEMNKQTKNFLAIFLAIIAALFMVSLILRVVYALVPIVVIGAICYFAYNYFNHRKH